MNETITIVIASGLVALSFGACISAAIWFGYWMGRNSSDKPLRSVNNPKGKGPGEKYVSPSDEPEGDLFNDAAFGTGEDGPGIPTIRGR